MRPRTPGFIWIPFVFSIGTISWALFAGALAVIAVIVLAPAVADVKIAEARRNNVEATLKLQDEYLALRRDFIAKAGSDVELMQRLAAFNRGIEKKGQETLILHPSQLQRDTSVQRLLAQSLPEIQPAEVAPLPWYLAPATHKPTRTMLLMIACGALALSFILGVRYDRPPTMAEARIALEHRHFRRVEAASRRLSLWDARPALAALLQRD